MIIFYTRSFRSPQRGYWFGRHVWAYGEHANFFSFTQHANKRRAPGFGFSILASTSYCVYVGIQYVRVCVSVRMLEREVSSSCLNIFPQKEIFMRKRCRHFRYAHKCKKKNVCTKSIYLRLLSSLYYDVIKTSMSSMKKKTRFACVNH